jgi:hypothetical protein
MQFPRLNERLTGFLDTIQLAQMNIVCFIYE